MKIRKTLAVLPLAVLLWGCAPDGLSDNPSSFSSSSSLGSSTSSSSASSSLSSPADSGDPLPSSTPSSATQEGDGVVTLFCVNDFHGKIEQDNGYNGIVALQGGILSNKDYEPSSLILSAGDMWQGGYISGLDNGKTTTELMNAFPFAAMTLGNHEFDWGVSQIQANEAVADFPFLCANLIDLSTGERASFVQSHALLESEGYKIGVVGAIGASLESSILDSAIAGYEFSSSLSLLQEAYDDCVAEGADVVVLSLHDDEDSSYTNSIQRSSIGFAGIFGGHSHAFQDEDDEKIPYVQGGSDSRGYSYMRIDVAHKNVEYLGYDYVDTGMAQDAAPSFEKMVEELIAENPPEVIGYIQGQWDKESSGRLVTKAMFEMAKALRPEKDYDASNLVALHNTGGIRSHFPSSSTPLEITMADLQLVIPFDNTVLLLPDRYVRSGSLSWYYSYPSADEITSGTRDIVAINYIVDPGSGGMLSEEGSEPIKGQGEGSYIIYDLVADYLRANSSYEHPIDAYDL